MFLTPLALGQDVRVTASVDSDVVGVQDQFHLTVTVSGEGSGDAENPRIGNLKNFRIVSGPNVSSQFQWINGRSSSSKNFIYILLPEKEGQFTLEPIEVRVRGGVFKTEPLQIRVTSAPQSPSPPQQRQRRSTPLDPFRGFDPFEEEDSRAGTAPESVFIRAELDRSSAYPGQQVTLSYQIYTDVSVSGIQLQESPPLTGFWVEDLEVEKKPRGLSRTVNGREYRMFTIKKQALFATTSGKLKIPSSIFAVSASTGRSVFDIFDRTETLYRRSPELTLDVKPLPVEGRPSDFTNAVGSFNLTAGIDKHQVAAGEAVALLVKLEGRGNLKMIPDLTLPASPGFTVYSSKRSDEFLPSTEDQIGGNKTWEFVIVPKAPGQQTFPPLSFSYFNAEREKYETVRTPALDLSVAPGADQAAALSGLSGAGKQDLVRRGTDINFIKLSAGNLEKTDTPLHQSVWFYLIAAIPLAFNAGAFLYLRYRSFQPEDTGTVRSRKAKRTAMVRLKIAEKEAPAQPRRFYDHAAAALSGYLAEKFNLAEIDLTGDRLDLALARCAVDDAVVRETKSCLQECDFGRFVSASQSVENMRDLSSRIRRNIDALEKARVFQDPDTTVNSR